MKFVTELLYRIIDAVAPPRRFNADSHLDEFEAAYFADLRDEEVERAFETWKEGQS